MQVSPRSPALSSLDIEKAPREREGKGTWKETEINKMTSHLLLVSRQNFYSLDCAFTDEGPT